MQILFVRHGESEDDIINAYGGWADFPLTERGKEQLEATAKKIKDLKISFFKVLSSPLERAKMSSAIIAKALNLDMEIFELVKERNTYGILSGMKKDEAKNKYPEIVEAYDKGKYVIGSEREADTNERVKLAYQRLSQRPEQNLIVVTHGNFIKALMPIALGKKLTKKEDGGFILIDTTSAKAIQMEGIEVE